MAHVELSWTESPPSAMPRIPERRSVHMWSATVDGAHEPCMVINDLAVIAAASMPACRLLGFTGPNEAIGQCLFDHALPLLDFTSDGAPLSSEELQRIPPVLALSSGLLARGVLRVRSRNEIITMDAVSTPLHEFDRVVGSLTFFSVV